jgi:hypothetical protein
MNNYEEIKFEYIQHFHEEMNCGWDIKVADEDVFVLLDEFPYLEIYDKEYSDNIHGSGYFYVRRIGGMSDEHTILYYRDMYNLIKEDYDRLYDRVKDITKEF